MSSLQDICTQEFPPSTVAPLPSLVESNGKAAGVRWSAAPGWLEILAAVVIVAAIFLATVSHFKPYFSVAVNSGDNEAYIAAASAIGHLSFHEAPIKQFLGYPVAMAALSTTGLAMPWCLLVVSSLCSLLSTVVCFRLWGGRVAMLFAISNLDWIQRSLLGGAEPLFILLLFGAFRAARCERWKTAALLAAGATITRPVGGIALVALGVFLLWKREYRKAALCTAIAGAVGTLYVLPFWWSFGDPLYQVHRYRAADWHSGAAFDWPLKAIIQSFLHDHAPWTNLVLTGGWIVFALAGFALLLWRKESSLRKWPVETLFAVLYVSFLFCYSSEQWARAEFPRFIIPALPMLLVAVLDWIPRDRRLFWALAAAAPVLAAASALGVRNVMATLGL